MNWLDIVIIVALAVSAFIGLRQGLIGSALSLAGLIIGVILAGNFYQPLSQKLTFIPSENAAKITAFVLILVGVMLIAAVLDRLLKLVTAKIMLGWVNYLGGAVFGFLQGAISMSVLLVIWVKLFGPGMVAESSVAGILLDKFPLVLALLPSEFDAIRDFFR